MNHVDMEHVGGEKPKSFKLTIEQCAELRKPPHINPITKRKLDPSALHGMYKKLMKECEEIESGLVEIIQQNPMKPAEPKASMVSSSRMKKLKKIRLRMALRNALKPILNRMDTHDNRIYFTKVIRKYNQHIEPCVQASEEKDNTLALVKKETFTPIPIKGKKAKPITAVKETIYFKKRIGSDSVYGTAYMNTGRGIGRALRFSIKIMSDKFKDEVNLLKLMSRLAETKKSPNMPITYDVLHCTNLSKNEIKTIKSKITNPSNILKKGKYYVVLSELANGDMNDFFLQQHSAEVYESVIMQVLISLSTFHSYIGYIHNDAHLGNFLFHKIPPGGYWHYQIHSFTKKTDTVDMFVPNTGYLMVLWDPGLAKRIHYSRQVESSVDFNRVLYLMGNISNIPSYINKGMKPIPKKMFAPFQLLHTLLYSDPNTELFELIVKVAVKYKMLQHIVFDSKNLPTNPTILNEKPYKIYTE